MTLRGEDSKSASIVDDGRSWSCNLGAVWGSKDGNEGLGGHGQAVLGNNGIGGNEEWKTMAE